MAQHPWRTQPASHRRSGPGQSAPGRWLGAARLRYLRLRRRGDRSRTARWLPAACVPGALAVVTARRRLGVSPAVALPVASMVPLAVAVTTPPGRWRYLAAGAAYMWVFKVTWELPYDDPEKLKQRLQVRYPVRIDSVLGGGEPPTLRLQRALRDPSRVSALDKAVTVVYGSWFVPHLVLAWILLRHQEFVPRAAGRLAAAYHLTTPFYWLLPTAPPWWASESKGEMDGQVQRVLRRVIADLRKQPERKAGESPGNPWGSMPSDHIASAAITAMGLSEVSVGYGVLGWSYVLLAGFSVVYLGEHYLVDVLAGLAVAEGVRLAEPLLNPFVRRLAHDLERFAPQTR